MARPKIKDTVRKSFSLDIDTPELINQGKQLNGFKYESSFIDYLVKNFFINSDPVKKLASIKEQKDELMHKIGILEIEEAKAIRHIEFTQKWRKDHSSSKKTIIQNIARTILRGDKVMAEDIAIVQSARFGIAKEELLEEACEVAGKI